MANTSLKYEVQSALDALLRAGPYYGIAYPPGTSAPAILDLEALPQPLVTPSSVGCNEVAARWSVDARHGRSTKLGRDSWLWLGIVKFNEEASSYEAEEAWAGSPPIIQREGQRKAQAVIYLVSAAYEHPPRQQPHGGSRIEYTFEVRRSRR